MKTLHVKTAALAIGFLVLYGRAAGAQVKVIQGDAVTVTATVEALEQSTRMLTLKGSDGIYETVQVPAEIKRFNELKVGDKITARYYENVVITVKKPGEAAVNLDTSAVTKSPGKQPGVTAAHQETVTVTVTAIDPKTHAVTVKGPKGYVYSRRVDDKKTLDWLKVGDRLDMTWTEAVLIGVESPAPAKKKS